MAKTTTDLYRSVMDKSFKIKLEAYPGDGVLYPSRATWTTWLAPPSLVKSS